jgi:hypothetical protein
MRFPNWEAPRGNLAYRNGHLAYTAPTLYTFLYLDLVTCPAQRLKKCARPDCQHPYFLAHHLGQNYCSEPCASWAQRRLKRDWWNRVGKKLRIERSGRKPRKIRQRKTRR